MDLEISSMQMILHSGNSRNDSYEAIKLAKQKKLKVKLIDFFQSNKSAAAFWDYVKQHGGFHQALYVDDDP